MKALPLACAVLLLASPARSGLPLVPLSGGGTIELGAAQDGSALIVDATAGDTTLVIPDIAALPAGFHIPVIFKADPTSNLVGFRVLKPGDRLNWFWQSDAPYPLWINLTQGAAELLCDGVSRCHLMAKPFQRSIPQSQRTFVVGEAQGSSFNVRPAEANEVVEINATAGAAGIYFEPVAHFTGGGYLSSVVEFLRMDASGNPVTIWAAKGEAINGAPSVALNGLHARLRCYIDSARITCN
ncbi:MAG: hypothetical protein IT563_19715 [Alphaproteobacteria bacterium]|nr:hypothetical protein [Alphaproteobacteria bacterium]